MDNKELKNLIYSVFDKLEKNNFKTLGMPDQPIWERPLIGVASGDDPYFDFLKEHIGHFNWNPKEVFELKYSAENICNPNKILSSTNKKACEKIWDNTQNNVEARDLRLISMVFPQTMQTKEAQKKEKVCPSVNWIVSRGEWEPLIKDFNVQLTKAFEEKGIRAASVDLQPGFSWHVSEKLGKASNFSHRHGAFAAGLGTFSLSDGLITEKGIAVRITSMIVEAQLEVTPRPYTKHNEWCLYFQDGSCGACIKRCPINAITKEGHDKEACSRYEDMIELPKNIDTRNYIFGCGLCQAGLPCTNKRP